MLDDEPIQLSDPMKQFRKDKIFKHIPSGNLCRIIDDKINVLLECGTVQVSGKTCAWNDRTKFAVSDVVFADNFEEHNPFVKRDYK